MKEDRDEHGAEDKPNPSEQQPTAPVRPADGESDPPPQNPGDVPGPGRNP